MNVSCRMLYQMFLPTAPCSLCSLHCVLQALRVSYLKAGLWLLGYGNGIKSWTTGRAGCELQPSWWKREETVVGGTMQAEDTEVSHWKWGFTVRWGSDMLRRGCRESQESHLSSCNHLTSSDHNYEVARCTTHFQIVSLWAKCQESDWHTFPYSWVILSLNLQNFGHTRALCLLNAQPKLGWRKPERDPWLCLERNLILSRSSRQANLANYGAGKLTKNSIKSCLVFY